MDSSAGSPPPPPTIQFPLNLGCATGDQAEEGKVMDEMDFFSDKKERHGGGGSGSGAASTSRDLYTTGPSSTMDFSVSVSFTEFLFHKNDGNIISDIMS